MNHHAQCYKLLGPSYGRVRGVVTQLGNNNDINISQTTYTHCILQQLYMYVYITRHTTPHNTMLVRRNAQYMYLCGISEFEIYWNKLLA